MVAPDKYMAEIPAPREVSELSVFLLPGIAFPPDKGVVIFYATPPFEQWTTLGTLYAARPSAVFRTGWSTNAEFATAVTVQVSRETNANCLDRVVLPALHCVHAIADWHFCDTT
jgi:hypothetical protein